MKPAWTVSPRITAVPLTRRYRPAFRGTVLGEDEFIKSVKYFLLFDNEKYLNVGVTARRRRCNISEVSFLLEMAAESNGNSLIAARIIAAAELNWAGDVNTQRDELPGPYH